MLEEQCRGVFEQACQQVIEKHTQLVRLKGGWPKPKNEFENYFKWDDKYYAWDGPLVMRVSRSRREDVIRDAFLYFVHSEKLRDAYIKQKYGNPTIIVTENGNYYFFCFFGKQESLVMLFFFNQS